MPFWRVVFLHMTSDNNFAFSLHNSPVIAYRCSVNETVNSLWGWGCIINPRSWKHSDLSSELIGAITSCSFFCNLWVLSTVRFYILLEFGEGIWDIASGAQGWLPSLCSGITPGDVVGNIWGLNLVNCVQGKLLNCCMYYLTSPYIRIFFYLTCGMFRNDAKSVK